MRTTILRLFLSGALAGLGSACGDGGDDDSATDGGADAGDAGSDADADADGDTDTDTDTADAGFDAGFDAGDYEPPALPGAPWFECLESGYPPAGATVVRVFDQEHQYHGGDPNRRTIEATAHLPEPGAWQRIDMLVRIECPADGLCDAWDRFADITLVDGDEEIELMRHMTPYGVPMCMLLDVTQFAPRLSGDKLMRSFIDTWVAADDPNWGHGWRTTVDLVFHPGEAPGGLPDELVQLWPYSSLVVGDPANPVAAQAGAKDVPIPAGTTRAELRILATGHGQGNAQNCAEFCPLTQEIGVNGTPISFDPWRADCQDNPLSTQMGTWYYPRAGWCPGAITIPKVFDITSAVTAGATAHFEYAIHDGAGAPYENTCRPGAGDTENVCEGCVFHPAEIANCDYNGGDHTDPVEKVAVQLLLYR